MACWRRFGLKVLHARRGIHLWSLEHRAVVSVEGRDCSQLLQGLLTADVQRVAGTAQYTMLLNPQGRVHHEAILYHTEKAVLMECDLKETDRVVAHLKKYALRSQVCISAVTEAKVYCTAPGYNGSLPPHTLAVFDPRTKSMGGRLVSVCASSEPVEVAPIAKYHAHRIACGVLEGCNEIPIGQCLPLELNLDRLNGVSFDKGCYLGQELTARTHHTGVVRKRVIPLALEKSPSQPMPWGTPVLVDGAARPVGKVLAHQGTLALGLVKLQEMYSEGLHVMLERETRRLGVKISKPPWWS